MKPYMKIIIIVIAFILLVILLGFAILVLTEYKPEEIENLSVEKNATKKLELEQTISLLTYNIGYLSLDKTQDFFLDGGKNVMPKNDENVKRNLSGVIDILQEENADINLLQEVDMHSKRSFYMNQYENLSKNFEGTATYSMYHQCLCVPYPIFNMVGYVKAGQVILNKFDSIATRIALPNAYSFPMSVVMFKRALMKQEIPIENSDKKLVIFNLHLEAYDNGDTRIKQLEILKEAMKEEYNKGNYVVAGGDFNQTIPIADNGKYPLLDTKNYMAPMIPQDYLMQGWNYAVDDTTPTCRLLNKPYNSNLKETTQFYVLDAFIVSPNIQIESVKTISTEFEYTDHNPVKMQIKLKKDGEKNEI